MSDRTVTGRPESVRIGCGSAGAIDRISLGVDMVRDGDVRYLALDCLAERSLALAHLRRTSGSGPGYDPRLAEIGAQLLPLARERGVSVIANLGAADPEGATSFLQEHAAEYGLTGTKLAVIAGDDVLDHVKQADSEIAETGGRVSDFAHAVVSANAYLGYEPVAEALGEGADVVIGGRIADASLFLGPLAHEFGWSNEDWDELAAGSCIAHLLECGTYVTGGNFADPPYNVVEDFTRPSLPLSDVAADGSAVLRKLPGSGGALNSMTCKLQLGYEIHDPAHHPTPDVVADFSHVEAIDQDDGGVLLRGAAGTPRPGQLKVVIGVAEGFIGENTVSFGGLGALERATGAKEILERRVAELAEAYDIEEWRVDLLGVNALHGDRSLVSADHPPYEVHVRAAGRCTERRAAEALAHEVEYLLLFGPAGAAAAHRTRIAQIVSTYSAYVDRELVAPSFSLVTL